MQFVDRQIDRWIDRQKYRQTERWIDRKIDRQKDRFCTLNDDSDKLLLFHLLEER